MKENGPQLSVILKIYKQAITNVPILKYSKVLIATSCILAFIAYLKLDNATVFYYALGVILVSFLCFLFSLFLQNNDPIIKFLRYLLVGSITVTTAIIILGFGSFIVWEKPIFFNRWFPNKNSIRPDSVRKITAQNSDEKTKSPILLKTKIHRQPKKTHTIQVLSIQLKEETKGYSKILINGVQVQVLAESTKLNPRIVINDSYLNKKITIVTNVGDTCISLLPSQINPSLVRFVPNCN